MSITWVFADCKYPIDIHMTNTTNENVCVEFTRFKDIDHIHLHSNEYNGDKYYSENDLKTAELKLVSCLDPDPKDVRLIRVCPTTSVWASTNTGEFHIGITPLHGDGVDLITISQKEDKDNIKVNWEYFTGHHTRYTLTNAGYDTNGYNSVPRVNENEVRKGNRKEEKKAHKPFRMFFDITNTGI